MLRFRLFVLGLTALSCWLGACGDDPTSVAGSMSDADAGGAEAAVDGCVPLTVESCACAAVGSNVSGMGTRNCVQGSWSACSCPDTPPPVIDEGSCLAGDYQGNFQGTYRSGFVLGAGIPVAAFDLTGGPGLKFTLEETSSNDPEFPVYTVSNGVVDGVADAAFPFNGKLTGTLDCKTKKFTGELDGTYTIVLDVGINSGAFKGPVTGDYDAIHHVFTFGTWTLHEEDALMIDVLGDAGGDGTWDAHHLDAP